ncbi:MAG: hypothetical protein JO006_14755 [Paucibacter sp.]|nr:hypothetical protein [Roseateles sp.]
MSRFWQYANHEAPADRSSSISASVTGTAAPPVIGAGGTYAKVIPNAYAFGMWMPGKAYTGPLSDGGAATPKA